MKTPKYNSGWIWAYFTHLHKNPAKFCYFKLLGYPQSVHQTPHWIQHPHRPTRWPPKNLHDGFHGTPHLTGTYDWHVVCLHDWLILIWIQRKNIYVVHAWTSWGDLEKQNCPRTRVQWQVGEGFGSGFCKHKHVMSLIRGEHPSFFLEVLVKHYHCNSPRLYVEFRWIFLNMLGWFCFSKWIPLF